MKGSDVFETIEIQNIPFGVMVNDTLQPIFADSRGTVLSAEGRSVLPKPFGDKTEHLEYTSLVDYAGMPFDEDLGVVRMGVRFYDPKDKVFITPDPLFFEDMSSCLESPIECNLFSYAKNNPLKYTDPTGNAAEDRFANHYDQLVLAGKIDQANAMIEGRAEVVATIMGTLEDLKPLPELLSLGGFTPLREAVQSVAGLFGRRAAGEAAELTSTFLRTGGGSNPANFVSVHSEKHMFDPARISTPNRSQYGVDIDVKALRVDTMSAPDRAFSDIGSRITKYEKTYDFNISTSDSPTGANRVFINNENPARSTQFHFVPRE